MSRTLSQESVDGLFKLFDAGYPPPSAARAVGVSREAAVRYFCQWRAGRNTGGTNYIMVELPDRYLNVLLLEAATRGISPDKLAGQLIGILLDEGLVATVLW